MSCEVATDFNNQGLGCNISIGQSSPKKGFFESFRKNSPKNKLRKSKENSWSNLFGKKSESKRREEDDDDRTAELISQLQLEGRSDEEIAMHLSFIHDVQPPHSPAPAHAFAPAPVPAPAPATISTASPKKNKSGITRWFREVGQMIMDEFRLTEEGYMIDERTLHSLTVSISSAPFYAAPPPDMGVSLEVLAMLQPMCVGSKCVNKLPACKHDGTPLPGNQINCPVCLCEFEKGEKLKSLPCVHYYHEECIDRWLMVGHSCPVCKVVVQ